MKTQNLHNMDSNKVTLAYQNEDDRAYGLAGMAISLAALNAIDRVAEVSLDAEGPMVSFSHAYYFAGSPSISPKATWDNLIQNFHITTAMVMANVLSRSLVRMKREAPRQILDEIHQRGHRDLRPRARRDRQPLQPHTQLHPPHLRQPAAPPRHRGVCQGALTPPGALRNGDPG